MPVDSAQSNMSYTAKDFYVYGEIKQFKNTKCWTMNEWSEWKKEKEAKRSSTVHTRIQKHTNQKKLSIFFCILLIVDISFGAAMECMSPRNSLLFLVDLCSLHFANELITIVFALYFIRWSVTSLGNCLE